MQQITSACCHQSAGSLKRMYPTVNLENLQLYKQAVIHQQLLQSESVVNIYATEVIQIKQHKILVTVCELMEGGSLTIPENGYPYNEAF